MAKVLLLNPNRWGRGITSIWIASHAGVLTRRGHQVRLFDATFFRDWAQNEIGFNTANQQYRPTAYDSHVTFRTDSIMESLQAVLNEFQPDVVFWSALSSHIHGEGEYVNIQHGDSLMRHQQCKALKVAGGLQPIAAPEETLGRFPGIDLMIAGESDILLSDLADALDQGRSPAELPGVVSRNRDGGARVNPRQDLIADLDIISPYDYSLFDDQVFWRPYNGQVVRAVDYELSRGCAYSCSYCVETVIQRYYGFEQTTPRGTILDAKRYLRCKSAASAFAEMKHLHEAYGVVLFRCQDTNFLTIERSVLLELAEMLEQAKLPIQLYIETRPEGINAKTIPLLQQLRVDGVGMGIELATQEFRESNLNRYSDQKKIVEAFEFLRQGGIKRTAYNIIGLPDQNEDSILDTIAFNRELDPDNVTVAFYSPFLGTGQQRKAAEQCYFDDYEFDVDAQLRSMSRHQHLTRDVLGFYKANFVRLVREGLEILPELKRQAGLG